ncbi:TrkA family potassium uptake protein [Salinisphaera sp.]|uniref:potassium channel family protein n=1 Tax=Salinisphaera sp. TaxID=1914330 RepID=UPI002D788AC8|nr:TrkA family potassium uptake protein [Salinisphaera sp.]HET7314525.1 TrkA family potassium uptake protein [Salinisphaera sp.]
MHIIVVGAEQVGEYLVRLALEVRHDVVLIESNEERAEHCAQTYDAQVLHATIGEEDILDEAGASQADALVATTADDSINLMAMVLGQEYEIPRLISTVNSNHRKPLFDRLGVSTLVDPEILAARHLLDLVVHPGGETVTSLSGHGVIYEIELDAGSILADRTLGEIDDDRALPENSCIVLIERDDQQLFPREDKQLRGGDNLLVFSATPLSQDDLTLFADQDE